jgi:uncharacterized protein (DUF305 family)
VLALICTFFIVLFLLLSFNVGHAMAQSRTPVEGSADVGFARDMQAHHAQAVEMSMLIRDRSTDPAVRTMAYDIALTQPHQGGQMFAWLREWDLPPSSAAEPMAWMHAPGTRHHGTHGASTVSRDFERRAHARHGFPHGRGPAWRRNREGS